MQATTNSTTNSPDVATEVRGRPQSRGPSLPHSPPVENREYDASYLGYILDSEDSRRERARGRTAPENPTRRKRRQQSRSTSPSPSKRQRKDSVTSSSSSAHSKHSSSSSSSSSPSSKKSKSSGGSNRSRKSRRERIRREVLLEYFEGIEQDLTCPICCELYAAPVSMSSCGHSACGNCLATWIEKKDGIIDCPVCRSALLLGQGLVPNYALSSLVSKHIELLAANGIPEWQENAPRRIDWETSKNTYEQLTKKKRIATEEAERKVMEYRAELHATERALYGDQERPPSPVANVRLTLGLEGADEDWESYYGFGQPIVNNALRRDPIPPVVVQEIGTSVLATTSDALETSTETRRQRTRGSQVEYD